MRKSKFENMMMMMVEERKEGEKIRRERTHNPNRYLEQKELSQSRERVFYMYKLYI